MFRKIRTFLKQKMQQKALEQSGTEMGEYLAVEFARRMEAHLKTIKNTNPPPCVDDEFVNNMHLHFRANVITDATDEAISRLKCRDSIKSSVRTRLLSLFFSRECDWIPTVKRAINNVFNTNIN